MASRTCRIYPQSVKAAICMRIAAATTVLTAGGVVPAIMAIGAVNSGVATAFTSVTVSAGMLIGFAPVYGISALSAASESRTVKEFLDRGNWGTVAHTAGGGVLGGVYAHNLILSTNKQPALKPEEISKK